MDPTRFRVRSRSAPALTRQDGFDELMAAQLSRTPWLGLSLSLHGLAVLLLLLWQGGPQPESEVRVAVRPERPAEPIEPEVPPPEPITAEPADPEPTLSDVEAPPPDAPLAGEPPEIPDVVPAPPDHIGLAGPGGQLAGIRGTGPGRGPDERTPPIIQGPIADGLRWLAEHQDADGRWDSDGFMKHDAGGPPTDGPGSAVHDVGVTGLALLAFLADGNTTRSGRYRDAVRRAARWLHDQQADNGRFGADTSHDFVYDHAIAAYAMCEAAGLSGDTLLRRTAQRGVDYLAAHRNPGGVWRYQPRDGDGDTSVTGWAVMTCKSARDFGLQVDPAAFDDAARWLDDVTGPDGHAGYTRRGEPSSRHPGSHAARFPPETGEALTAVALMCRFFLGQDPDQRPVMKRAAERILRALPRPQDPGAVDHYYWYHASYALYQLGGRPWREWSSRLTGSVLATQRDDGNWAGSWDPSGVWGEDGGRVYSTAMMVLSLQAYYRYSRLLR